MNRIILFLATLCPVLGPLALSAAAPTKPFELRDDDRVVFLGDTLMEREKDYGYIELMMTLRFPERNVTFRNLGWSADTPVGISRVSFDWPKGEGEMFRVLMSKQNALTDANTVLFLRAMKHATKKPTYIPIRYLDPALPARLKEAARLTGKKRSVLIRKQIYQMLDLLGC